MGKKITGILEFWGWNLSWKINTPDKIVNFKDEVLSALEDMSNKTVKMEVNPDRGFFAIVPDKKSQEILSYGEAYPDSVVILDKNSITSIEAYVSEFMTGLNGEEVIIELPSEGGIKIYSSNNGKMA